MHNNRGGLLIAFFDYTKQTRIFMEDAGLFCRGLLNLFFYVQTKIAQFGVYHTDKMRGTIQPNRSYNT